MAIVNLALLWGHIPRGIIRTSRNICKRYESVVPFALSRDSITGRAAQTVIHSFGSYHIHTSIGPFPVSLVEMSSWSTQSIPLEVVARLHTISVGYPIVGDQLYTKHEKYYNPVVSHPSDDIKLALQPWYEYDSDYCRLILSDSLSPKLLDHGFSILNLHDSMIVGDIEDSDVEEVDSNCRYVDHPRSQFVRRDRGKV
jgi:hypothetical protein